jgi:hypothetical protein
LEVYCKIKIHGNGNGNISCAPLLPVNLGSLPRIARCHDLRALPEQPHAFPDSSSFISFQPVQEVDFPAVTLCNPKGHDTGEYVRAVFNNFLFLEKNVANKSSRLKELFKPFMDNRLDMAAKHVLKWAG